MIKFENVKVLKIGRHDMKDNKLDVGSTVTLIKSDKNVLVDTGGFGDDWKDIKNALARENLTPENIEVVILTHLHIDHTANTNMFKNARAYLKFKNTYPGQFHDIKGGYLQRFEIKDNVELVKDVSIILTPGHSPDMISVVVETDKGKIVVAGDAVPDQSWADLSKEASQFVDIPKFVK